jgi:hypothetical protein
MSVTNSVLNIVSTELHGIGVPYEFMQWTSAVEYPYFVGEYSEEPVDTEDGYKSSTILLTGTTKGKWLELEQYRAKIENHFAAVGGLRKSTDNGTVVIFYANSFPVPTGEADLKRIQINLQVKEWRNIR